MAQKSEVVRRLDVVQRGLAQLVKPLGFRSKGRTLFRTVDTDMRQVIDLQSGMFEIGPPLPREAAFLRPNLYGKFTVNVGVFVPEMYERSNPPLPPNRVICDAHCNIRARLWETAGYKDVWWSLDEEPAALIDKIGTLLIDYGILFLERFGSRDLIVRDWVKFNAEEISLSHVGRLDVAMILIRRGETDAARALFEEHMTEYRKDPRNPGHEARVREWALRYGIGELS